MIATERCVFLHLHKSGGTFVNECLLRFVPGARQLGYHLPRSMIPQELRALPMLGLVRNPWSYYVSWYVYQSTRRQKNALFRILSDNGQLAFEPTIRNMLNLGTSGERLDELIAALPPRYMGTGLNLPGFALEPIRDSGLGFYTFLYRYMYGGAGESVYVGRMESLRTELAAMLVAVGQPLLPAMRTYLEAGAARNASEHGPYDAYYDDDLRRLVARRDAEVITRHEYRCGQ